MTYPLNTTQDTPFGGLISRSYNGTPIARRTSDGYVNATAMCKANDKRWGNYFQTDRATQYLEALSGSTGIPAHQLFETFETGPNEGRGTWVHPQVAVDLARWISAPFAVWMDGWFLEEVNGRVSQVRDTQLPAPNVLDTVDRSIDLLERLGGIDERAQMLLRDVILNNALNSAGGSAPALAGVEYFTLAETLIELGCPAHKATKLASNIGGQVKNLYREQNGREPKTQPQLVNGAKRKVAIYEPAWLEGIKKDLKETISNFLAA